MEDVSSPSHDRGCEAEREQEGAQTVDPVVRQHLFVMRHGERLDTQNRKWKETAARPYDTPITPKGKREALRVARQRFVGKNIAVVYSSPFLRCMQTAHQVCTALDHSGIHLHNGLAEIIGPGCGMRWGPPEVPAMEDAQADGIKTLTIDKTPFLWPETVQQAIERYRTVFQELAGQHWPDSLMIVTHEYGVMQAMVLGGCTDEVEATYCGHVELSRGSPSEHQWTIERYCDVYKYDTPG